MCCQEGVSGSAESRDQSISSCVYRDSCNSSACSATAVHHMPGAAVYTLAAVTRLHSNIISAVPRVPILSVSLFSHIAKV